MKIKVPKIIQGGMGVAVSDSRLARAVSMAGQLGVVSGTGLTQMFARRLQDGDFTGEVRRALSNFPFPKMAQRMLDVFYQPEGREENQPYKAAEKIEIKSNRWADELGIIAGFVEIFLAKENHSNPVGINLLEKIQIPHLPILYGARLAGVSVVIMGAGIPTGIPGALDAMAEHKPASYCIQIKGATSCTDCIRTFDPADFIEEGFSAGPLLRPDFLPIISTDLLATMLLRQVRNSTIEGFIVESHIAGGHNAPPRGKMILDDEGQPVYGVRDTADLQNIAKLGLPFWLAGGYGSHAKFQEALDCGAAGVQVGTPFALCRESGFSAHVKHELISAVLAGKSRVYTDRLASPTGYPFKVADVSGTLSEPAVFESRRRVCDLGLLREYYVRENGTIGFRCAAEPVEAYVAKGGDINNTHGRKCICNALLSAAGKPQIQADGTYEPEIITIGDDVVNIGLFCAEGNTDFTAKHVIKTILG